ncbi:HNH endonuclease [Brevibacillus porteri]|uniref:HNH endonuclease n=1 Tax=Brevibacillus porteri TaxID=2126350 RepID=UPI00362D5CB2
MRFAHNKLSYEFIVSEFNKRNCELLETEYISNKHEMRYRCIAHRENIGTVTYDVLRRERFIPCHICKSLKRYNEKFNKFKQFFHTKDYKLLYDDSIDFKLTVDSKLFFICAKHNDIGIQETTFELLKYSNSGCKKCSNERRANAKRRSFSIIATEFEKKNYQLVETQYKNDKTPMAYICNTHPKLIQYVTMDCLTYNNHNCTFCHSESMSGENNPFWKGTTSEDNRFRKSIEYKLWRKSVFERDNYSCQACCSYGGSLHAHHIENYSSNPEKRTMLENGITLCEDCHDVTKLGSFHNTYGTYNNTREQLEQFIKIKQNNNTRTLQCAPRN